MQINETFNFIPNGAIAKFIYNFPKNFKEMQTITLNFLLNCIRNLIAIS